MAFLDDLSQKIAQAGQSVAQKTKDTTEIMKINGNISDEEKHLSELFLNLGKSYYEAHKSDSEEAFSAIVSEITDTTEKIKDYSEQVRRLKGLIDCPNCGKEIAYGMAFCTNCGTPAPTAEEAHSEEDGIVCSNCGKILPEGTAFCVECGTKVFTEPENTMEDISSVSTTDAKTCTKCGKVLEEGMLFCTECGTKVEANQASADNTKKCTNCGAELNDGMLFCTQCGTKVASVPIVRHCTNCGRVVSQDDKFCVNCGEKVQ